MAEFPSFSGRSADAASIDAAPFHLVQLQFDAGGLAGLERRRGLTSGRHPVDTSYLVHCALVELFQQQAPKPFWVVESDARNGAAVSSTGPPPGRFITVLAYASLEAAALHELAKGFAGPAAYNLLRWDRFVSKPMPDVYPEGMRLGFEVRVCPVVRKHASGSALVGTRERVWSAGQEIDVFLDQAWQHPDEPLDRETVYVNWLAGQLAGRGGACLETTNGRSTAGMNRFSLEKMTRRTQGQERSRKDIQRPDVTLTGVLTVTDGPRFGALLRQGLGRHRSFGFGMLRIRRP